MSDVLIGVFVGVALGNFVALMAVFFLQRWLIDRATRRALGLR